MLVDLHYDSIADLCRTRVASLPNTKLLPLSVSGKNSATPPLCCENTQNELTVVIIIPCTSVQYTVRCSCDTILYSQLPTQIIHSNKD